MARTAGSAASTGQHLLAAKRAERERLDRKAAEADPTSFYQRQVHGRTAPSDASPEDHEHAAWRARDNEKAFQMERKARDVLRRMTAGFHPPDTGGLVPNTVQAVAWAHWTAYAQRERPFTRYRYAENKDGHKRRTDWQPYDADKGFEPGPRGWRREMEHLSPYADPRADGRGPYAIWWDMLMDPRVAEGRVAGFFKDVMEDKLGRTLEFHERQWILYFATYMITAEKRAQIRAGLDETDYDESWYDDILEAPVVNEIVTFGKTIGSTVYGGLKAGYRAIFG